MQNADEKLNIIEPASEAAAEDAGFQTDVQLGLSLDEVEKRRLEGKVNGNHIKQ